MSHFTLSCLEMLENMTCEENQNLRNLFHHHYFRNSKTKITTSQDFWERSFEQLVCMFTLTDTRKQVNFLFFCVV